MSQQKPVLDLLIIDDESDMEIIFAPFLERTPEIKKFEFTCEGRKIESHYLENFRIRCIVCDLFLGPITGIDILRVVAKTQPWCKRMLISGAHQDNLIEEGLGEGTVQKVFYKPFKVKEFIASIVESVKECPLEDNG